MNARAGAIENKFLVSDDLLVRPRSSQLMLRPDVSQDACLGDGSGGLPGRGSGISPSGWPARSHSSRNSLSKHRGQHSLVTDVVSHASTKNKDST